MPTTDPWIRKLIDLRYRYGAAAGDYFEANPVCEVAECAEDRIAVLNVHHKHGKAVDEFQTLCFNCHMLEHAATPEFTARHRQAIVAQQAADRAVMDSRAAVARELKSTGLSLREIGRRIGVSHITVRNYLNSGVAAS
jgi:hypothetical protein